MSSAVDALTAVVAAEEALATGDLERAHARLVAVAPDGVPQDLVGRVVDAMLQVNRQAGRHEDTLAWVETALRYPHDAGVGAVLRRARIECLRSIDTRRTLELADEALGACEIADDEAGYAAVLAHAAFAAYRRGEVRETTRFARMASSRAFTDPRAIIMALRARMYAMTAAAQHEQALDLSMEIRDRALDHGDLALAANECNNIAEAQLKLGRPLSAIEAATRAGELAERGGIDNVARFARVLVGVGMAENGDLDTGISALRRADMALTSPVLASDTWVALSFWLAERDGEGDCREAVQIAQGAVAQARDVGLNHYLTTLLSTEARALARLGEERAARAALEEARSAFDSSDMENERHLALAMGEVLSPGDPTRRTALGAARAHLLRDAGNRDDPLAYCTGVRIHRRLLEMTGGVPLDLPRAR